MCRCTNTHAAKFSLLCSKYTHCAVCSLFQCSMFRCSKFKCSNVQDQVWKCGWPGNLSARLFLTVSLDRWAGRAHCIKRNTRPRSNAFDFQTPKLFCFANTQKKHTNTCWTNTHLFVLPMCVCVCAEMQKAADLRRYICPIFSQHVLMFGICTQHAH